MARIVFAEDDEVIAEELSLLLSKNGHEPIRATAYERLSAEILEANPELVLLDLGLPQSDGSLVCRELRSQSAVPILILTSRNTEMDEVLCMSLGADSFIGKPYSSHILLAHIDALLRRAGLSKSSQLSCLGLMLDIERSRLSTGESSLELTKNEMKILALLMRHSPKIVPRETLMAELWDSGDFVDDNTLTVNINRVRQALTKLGKKELLTTHRGQGYALEA